MLSRVCTLRVPRYQPEYDLNSKVSCLGTPGYERVKQVMYSEGTRVYPSMTKTRLRTRIPQGIYGVLWGYPDIALGIPGYLPEYNLNT